MPARRTISRCWPRSNRCKPGDVLVCTTGNFTGCAVTGDLVLGMARNCGAVGFVTDGCVRDLPGIRMVGTAVLLRRRHTQFAGAQRARYRRFRHLARRPPVAGGDIVVADQDGVVVIPQSRLDEVIARLPAIRKSEAEMDQAVRDGMRMPAFRKPD